MTGPHLLRPQKTRFNGQERTLRTGVATLGIVVLGAAWLGPLPGTVGESFSAHMAVHMSVVAIAAPLIVIAIAGTRIDPIVSVPKLGAPIHASIVELIVVWTWHMPAFHRAAQQSSLVFAFEQATFLGSGLWLWAAAFGGRPADRPARRGAGVMGLLLTSMHMTLLGALIALGPRPLFHQTTATQALADQHVGGSIMLIVGSIAYLAGALWLTADMLRPRLGEATETTEHTETCATETLRHRAQDPPRGQLFPLEGLVLCGSVPRWRSALRSRLSLRPLRLRRRDPG